MAVSLRWTASEAKVKIFLVRHFNNSCPKEDGSEEHIPPKALTPANTKTGGIALIKNALPTTTIVSKQRATNSKTKGADRDRVTPCLYRVQNYLPL